MPLGGCRTWQSQWTLAIPEPLTMDEEDEATSEEGEANTEITSPPTASKATLLPLATPQMHAFNADK